MKQTILSNCTIVQQNQTIEGSIIMEDDIISDITPDKNWPEGEDCKLAVVGPGIIDIHSDYIEREIFPRPNTGFPHELALRFLDSRAVSCGITTLLNGISLQDNEKNNRTIESGIKLLDVLDKMTARGHFSVRHYAHARLDVTTGSLLDVVDRVCNTAVTKMAVYNDHTPGDRQYRDVQRYIDFVSFRTGKTRDELEAQISKRQEFAKTAEYIKPALAEKLSAHDVVIGSHDDVDRAHVDEAALCGASLCEFPITKEAAVYARSKGLHVSMGAPNLVLGKSQSGNVSCAEVLEAGGVDALCSDYHFPAMLASVLLLRKQGMPLHEAMKLISLNPAKILGIDDEFGSIEIGKKADMVLFHPEGVSGFIHEVIIGGRTVFTAAIPPAYTEGSTEKNNQNSRSSQIEFSYQGG